MALTNYTELQASVANFLHRSDLTAIIPDLITLAEHKIYSDLNSRKQDSIATLATVSQQEFVAMPTDLINVRAMVNATKNTTIDYKSPDALAKEFVSGVYGAPNFYTIVGDNFYFAPVPDAAYALRIAYQAKVPALSVSGTNWLMTNYPSVYLYATLCCSAPYLKDDSRVQVWEALYQQAIQGVNSADWSSSHTPTVRGSVTI